MTSMGRLPRSAILPEVRETQRSDKVIPLYSGLTILCCDPRQKEAPRGSALPHSVLCQGPIKQGMCQRTLRAGHQPAASRIAPLTVEARHTRPSIHLMTFQGLAAVLDAAQLT